MKNDYVQTFLLDDLDIRGAFVRLGPAWQKMLAGRNYPVPVAELLGEVTATTLLIASTLKQKGRLTIQLRGKGALSLLLVDCNERLQMRGMARSAAEIETAPLPELVGEGNFLLSLNTESMEEPYLSVVPLEGNTTAEIFDNYLGQSEQVPSRLFLAASPEGIGGLFLQKLPSAEERDSDGWTRCEVLASTVKREELLTLSTDKLLTRLFSEENIRVFDAQPASYHCPEDSNKVRFMLRSLGRAEVEAVLKEHGEVVIKDDICNREYRFDAQAIEEIFAEPAALSADVTTTLH